MNETQDRLFWDREGDAWLDRNRGRISQLETHSSDWPLKLIDRHHLKPKSVLEIGCSNGWRLDILRSMGANVIGVDPSDRAVQECREKGIPCARSTAASLEAYANVDLVIVYFVLHWVDRRSLLTSLANIDSVVAPGGHLILGDFHSDYRQIIPYKHFIGAYTYKQDYVRFFVDTGLYKVRDDVRFDHRDAMQRDDVPPDHMARCTLLTKYARNGEGMAYKDPLLRAFEEDNIVKGDA